MSEEITLSLPIFALEELRCFLCKGYLSCGPVRPLPNGRCICGRCSTPLDTDTPIHRLVAFEGFLSKVSFPCVFKEHGCTETLLFNKTTEHESKCFYRPVACPIKAFTTCLWEGPVSQFLHHFNNDHPDFVKEEAEFKLEVNEDGEGIFMINENLFAFIVAYSYNPDERICRYDVRFCGNQNGFDVFCRIQLINDTDSDCNINLKMNECLSYDESFYHIENSKDLNIDQFLECLTDPDCIVVALKLKVITSNCNNVTTAHDCEVNFDLIETLKCFKCDNYLVPPLFNLEGETICCKCSKTDSEPSNDVDLLKRVTEAVYPCRWRECNFVGKSNIFKDHEMHCQFRLYGCVYESCETTFKLSATVAHLQTHLKKNIVYAPDKITYRMSFAKFYKGKVILTFKKNRIIGVHHKMIRKTSLVQRIGLFHSYEDNAYISCIVKFEHAHCKLKSKAFNVSSKNWFEVDLKQLPPCFKITDVLTVTIEHIC